MDWGQEGGIYFMDFLQEYRDIESNSEARTLMFVYFISSTPSLIFGVEQQNHPAKGLVAGHQVLERRRAS